MSLNDTSSCYSNIEEGGTDMLSLSNNPSQKAFQCGICMKYFSRKFTLEMHILIHKGVKPHMCPYCGRCFRQKGTLMRHKSLHSQVALFQCELCHKSYRQKNIFLHHLKHTHKVSTDSLDRRKCTTRFENSVVLPPFATTTNLLTLNENISEEHIKADSISKEQSNVQNDNSNQKTITEDSFKMLKNRNSLQSYWRCDICHILVPFDAEVCRKHIASHHIQNSPEKLGQQDDSLTENCQLKTIKIQNTTLNASNSFVNTNFAIQDSATRSYMQLIKNNSIRESEEVGVNPDATLTCIPCQLDFETEDDFECHVKSHVQSVLNEFSDSEQPEMKYYHSGNNINVENDSFECGNPYDLLNAVVAGASTVLNTMSNIKNVEDIHISTITQNSKKSNIPIVDKVSNESNLSVIVSSKQSLVSNDQLKIYLQKSSNPNALPQITEITTLSNVKKDSNYSQVKNIVYTKDTKKKVERVNSELKRQLNLPLRNLKCNICNRRFLQKSLLLQHTRMIHGQHYKCNKCRKDFSYEKIFYWHEKNCGITKEQQSITAPVIDLSKLNMGNEFDYIVGIIPIEDPSQSRSRKKVQLGIPVIRRDNIFNIPSNLPIIGKVLLNREF